MGYGSMSDTLRAKWDARYAYSGDSVPPPAEVLSRYAHALPTGGRALDLACGRAGNGEWLAQRGFEVTAWDVSPVVIDSLKARPGSAIAYTVVRDVLEHPPSAASFEVIVVTRFLERSLCDAIAAALVPGGVLFYQTFTHGLSNPDYLLREGELPTLFSMLKTEHFSEQTPNADGRAEAMLVARAASDA